MTNIIGVLILMAVSFFLGNVYGRQKEWWVWYNRIYKKKK